MTELIRQAMARITADTGKIQMGRGKLYTTVASRIEAMRYIYGESLCIETEILVHPEWRPGIQSNDSVIVVRASILNAAGTILATGHAEEIRGSNRMTETSALEVCETSAIGRALASLGLHGGEYASAQEIEVAERKRSEGKIHGGTARKDPFLDNVQPDNSGGGRQASPDGGRLPSAANEGNPVADAVGSDEDRSERGSVPKSDVKTSTAAFILWADECQNVAELRQFWAKNKKILDDLKESAPDQFVQVRDVFASREKALKKGA